MDHSSHNKIVSFIWSIADDCLRDVFVRGKYRDVILPMFVLRRIDCLLEESKEEVFKEIDFQKNDAKMSELDPKGLSEASGQVFYNISKFTLKSLLGNPSQLQTNFNIYLDGYSPNVKEIIEKFDLRNQIRKMADADALHGVIEKFTEPRINLSHLDTIGPEGRKLPGLTNLGMGYVFEELIRKFNEDNNEEAGEHFTPREVIQLMVHLLFEPVKDQLPPVITIYDPACGSGGMLTEAEKYILDPEGPIKASSDVYLYGKEINPETYAICKSDMLIKGENPENIKYGSTLATDSFSDMRFDFMLSNPPYGKSWKTDQGQILDGKDIIDPRFEVTLPDRHGVATASAATPAVSDGQLLFLMEMVDKLKSLDEAPLGSRIATVHNGSALFTGDAGGGASNIRQYLIENDYLEAIVQLPNNIFYNTGITTYIWVLSNSKPDHRVGKVQLIDASQLYQKLQRNLGDKNCAFTPEHITQITQAYLDLADTGKEATDGLKSQVFDNRDFGYWKVTIERPLRKSAQWTEEKITTLRYDKALSEEMEYLYQTYGKDVYTTGFLTGKKETIEKHFEKEGYELKPAQLKKLLNTKAWLNQHELLEAAENLIQHAPSEISHDFNTFLTDTKALRKKLKLKLTATHLKKILDSISWRNPEAAPILKGMSVFDYNQYGSKGSGYKTTAEHAALYGHYEIKAGFHHYETDSELRDTESVPLTYPGGIEAYFLAEVLPHVPDAWIAEDSTKVGYEISFNKYFYVHQPLRQLDEVISEIRTLEQETEGLLEEILNF
jgi:type I restriction enzyme M protein